MNEFVASVIAGLISGLLAPIILYLFLRHLELKENDNKGDKH